MGEALCRDFKAKKREETAGKKTRRKKHKQELVKQILNATKLQKPNKLSKN